MTDAINNQSRVTNTTLSIDNKSQPAQKSASNTSSQTTSSTVVDIKSTKILEAMSAKIDQLPDMDLAKIDTIKLSIANGDYQPNADVIAQKFTEIERLL